MEHALFVRHVTSAITLVVESFYAYLDHTISCINDHCNIYAKTSVIPRVSKMCKRFGSANGL